MGVDHKIQVNPRVRMLMSALPILILLACSTMPTKTYSPAAQEMRNDASYINTSYLEACVVGAGVGALGGYLTARKDDKNEKRKRVIVGASAGCALAMGANYFLQSKRDQYASEEEKMQAVLANIRQENEKLTKLVRSSKAVVEEDKRKIAQVKEAYRSNQISLEEADAQLTDVDSDRVYFEKTLSNLEERERQWIELGRTLRDSQAPSDMQEMDREIARLQNNIALLKNELETLEEARDISTIG